MSKTIQAYKTNKAQTGYVMKFSIYTGKANQDARAKEVGLGESVVLKRISNTDESNRRFRSLTRNCLVLPTILTVPLNQVLRLFKSGYAY